MYILFKDKVVQKYATYYSIMQIVVASHCDERSFTILKPDREASLRSITREAFPKLNSDRGSWVHATIVGALCMCLCAM